MLGPNFSFSRRTRAEDFNFNPFRKHGAPNAKLSLPYFCKSFELHMAARVIKRSLDFPWYKEWSGADVKLNVENIEHVYKELTQK